MKIKREQFVDRYVNWLRFRMREVLPAEASPYRMMEIARRQHHSDVRELVTAMEKLSGDKKISHLVEASV